MPSSAPAQRRQARQARSRATVEAILEAAAQILEREGLVGLSTNAAAARAGVSIGTLYQYFPNKEAVLGALVRRERAPLLADVLNAVERDSWAEALTELVTAAVRHQLRRPKLARALDQMEPFLALDQETDALQAALGGAIAGFLATHGHNDAPRKAADLVALSRGMIDAAGLRGETDEAALTARVTGAVRGYLRYAP